MITEQKTANGFQYIEIENKSCTAKVALQGGHLFHYQQHGQKPLLWVSSKSHFKEGKAIRGGIPICWPWFGKHSADPTLPQHGFARTSTFELLEVKERDENSTELTLLMLSSAETHTLWPYQFQLLLHITVGQTLSLALTSRNCDTKPFTISSALHSYFAVSEIGDVSVKGLEGKEYWNALTGDCEIQQGSIHIREEVDRVYQQTTDPLQLSDADRSVRISSAGSASAVVWNPWKEKSAKMGDMENDAYRTMLCIETANALQDARTVLPGEEHTLQLRLTAAAVK